MNISFTAFALDTGVVKQLPARASAAIEYIQEFKQSAKTTSETHLAHGVVLYNTNDCNSAWRVPCWSRRGKSVMSFSSPPISADHEIATAEEYVDRLFHLTASDAGLETLNPGYFGARLDGDRLRIWSDRLGVGRCYFVCTRKFIAASNHLGTLAFFLDSGLEVDEQAWLRFAGVGWFCNQETPYAGIQRIRPGTVFTCQGKAVSTSCYADVADLTKARGMSADYGFAADGIRRVVRNAATMASRPPSVYLSGGRDSRLTAAAWLASGASAPVTTYGTLEQERIVAEELMCRARQTLDLERQGITHLVTVPSRANATQGMEERLSKAMSLWDGDHAPIRIMRDVYTDSPAAASLGGGGGEIAQPIYYSSAHLLAEIENAERPLDRLVPMFAHGATTPDTRQLVISYLRGVEDEAKAMGIRGASTINYFYLTQKFRRWTGAGHQTSAILLFAVPAS